MLQKLNTARRRLMTRGPALGRGGFTLVEIMMVLLILALGIIPVAIIQHQARREVTESDRYTEGIIVAQTQLERIKGMGFGNAVPDSGNVGNVDWVARVNNVSFGLDRVVVTATWQNDGVEESLTVTDLMSLR
jgi:prepilin-type N-terminal cleavage/methylation domain-containing protein